MAARSRVKVTVGSNNIVWRIFRDQRWPRVGSTGGDRQPLASLSGKTLLLYRFPEVVPFRGNYAELQSSIDAVRCSLRAMCRQGPQARFISTSRGERLSQPLRIERRRDCVIGSNLLVLHLVACYLSCLCLSQRYSWRVVS